MKIIYKYPLIITDNQGIEMPKGSKIVLVSNQQGQLCIWAEVDTDQPMETREFDIIGTGNTMSDRERKHIGSALIDPYVWHVYERV